jgi:predicted lipid-binding transport protein (Tim44 family)
MNTQSPAAARAQAAQAAGDLMDAISRTRASVAELGAARDLYRAVIHTYTDHDRATALRALARLAEGL